MYQTPLIRSVPLSGYEAYDVSPLISVVPNLELGYVNIGFTGCILCPIWKRGVSKSIYSCSILTNTYTL